MPTLVSARLRSATVLVSCFFATVIGLVPVSGGGEESDRLEAAVASRDITPDARRPVYLAGYGYGRLSTGIHDPLFARGLVLREGSHKIALVAVDLIGLQYPAVQRIRAALPDFDYVLVASTHNHEGPDVIGIWGRTPWHRGVDEAYVEFVIQQVVDLIHEAEDGSRPAAARYGTAADARLLDDRRLPIVKDDLLRTLRLVDPATQENRAILVQWACHPEALGSSNTLLTADFPASTIAALETTFGCPAIFFAGAIGGLMAPPQSRIRDNQGRTLGEGDFEFARRYGEAVARLAAKALRTDQAIQLAPFGVSARPIIVPIENPLYRAARALGVLRREGHLWTGDFDAPGPLVTARTANQPLGTLTEVAYVRLGELEVAGIPGEVYPELVYGQIEDPADPAADEPDAASEPAIADSFTGNKWLLFGLANDEIGYILPRRQWDVEPPFAYGRSTAQYGEINSCGAGIGPIICEAFRRRVLEIAPASSD